MRLNMNRCIAIPIVWATIIASAAAARDSGQWPNATPAMKNWFNNQQSPGGGFCCSIADGYPAEWRTGEIGYEVFIDGVWVPVPADTILYGTSNPTGSAVVWYSHSNGVPVVRCFVPGDGT
jgi:hypothetical protein